MSLEWSVDKNEDVFIFQQLQHSSSFLRCRKQGMFFLYIQTYYVCSIIDAYEGCCLRQVRSSQYKFTFSFVSVQEGGKTAAGLDYLPLLFCSRKEEIRCADPKSIIVKSNRPRKKRFSLAVSSLWTAYVGRDPA